MTIATCSSVATFHVPLRRSVPKQPPSDENQKPEDHSGGHQGAPPHSGPDGGGGADFDAIEAQGAAERAGTRPGPESRNRISSQTDFYGDVRKVENFVDSTSRLGSIGCKRPRGQKTAAGPQAR